MLLPTIYETAALCIFNIYKNKRQECIIFILLQSIYTPVVDIHVFTQLGHFCYFIDTIGSLLKKGFDCSRLSISYWIMKQILYSLSNTNHNITCLTLLRLGEGGGTLGSGAGMCDTSTIIGHLGAK